MSVQSVLALFKAVVACRAAVAVLLAQQGIVLAVRHQDRDLFHLGVP